ncbi:hypothetical protein RvY_08651 [Ramazzottius varieornatus]|uniref:Uncharacterized protein n=1 Tax=Ramazzottius varieornatus TaxID=947166 RepID=A0A1D1VB91_RAMVA|nr:hypothetical protein RvY_08651 [Ramazzottius varieornatus]
MSERTPVTFLSQDYGRRIAAVKTSDQELKDLLQVYTNLVKSTVGKERPNDE